VLGVDGHGPCRGPSCRSLYRCGRWSGVQSDPCT
jgi:hypothetical protein